MQKEPKNAKNDRLKKQGPKLTKLHFSIVMSLLVSPVTWADPADEYDFFSLSIEELLELQVETRKIKESYADLPLASTVYTDQQMNKNGIASIYELAEIVPNFSYRPSFGKLQERGVTRGVANAVGDNVTGLYIDGMSMNSMINSLDLTDYQYTEVIKGPQATLYGRNTFAGAVNIVSHNPLEQQHNLFSFTSGSNNYKKIKLRTGLQLRENLATQFDVSLSDKEGEYNNVLGDGGGRLGDESSQLAKLQLAWKKHDFNIATHVNYLREEGSPYTTTLQPGSANNCFLETRRQYYCGELRTPSSIGYNNTPLIGRVDNNYVNDVTWFITRADYRFNEHHRVEFNLGLTSGTTDYFVDGDYSTVQFSWIDIRDGIDTSEYELKVNSNWTEKLTSMVGITNYEKDTSRKIDSYILADQALLLFSETEQLNWVDNMSIYANLSYQYSPQIDLIFDARVAKDKIRFGNGDEQGSNTFTALNPKFTVRNKLSADSMFYTSLSKGTKPGGFNTALWGEDFAAAEDQGLVSQYQTFEQESLWQIEAGYKGLTLDKTLSVHVSTFAGLWTDLQTSQSLSLDAANDEVLTASFIDNGGETSVFGFELDLKQQISEQFHVWGNLGWVNTEIRESSTDAQFQLTGNSSIEGNQVANVPEVTLAVGTNYHGEISGWEYAILANMNHESERFVAEHNLATVAPITKFRFGLQLKKDNWHLDLLHTEADNYIESAARLGDPATFFRLRAFALSLSEGSKTELKITYRFD